MEDRVQSESAGQEVEMLNKVGLEHEPGNELPRSGREAHNQLGLATQEEGMLDALCLEPSNKVNYSGPKSADQNLEESATGPDFYVKASVCSPLLNSDFRRTCGGKAVV
ncbi:hypothetical protein Ancab_039318 [Ancistrocladus abbreviatus]